MDIRNDTSDDAVMRELGLRLRDARLNRRLTQRELADRAGLTEQTLRKMENGSFGQVRNLSKALRALGLLGNVDALIPAPAPSPIMESDRGGRRPQRVRHKSSPSSGWEWGEDE